MRARDLRYHTIYFFEHPYGIAAGDNERPLIGGGGEILIRFFVLSLHPGRRVAQIPGCALKAGVRSALYPPDRLATVVVYQKLNFRFRFLRFCPQFIVGRVGKRLVFVGRVFFGLLPLFLPGLDLLFQLCGKNGAVRRILRAV